MPDKIKFFTADYRDKFVYIGKYKFKVGCFVVDFLNKFYDDDTAARISCMTLDNYVVSTNMELGFVNEHEFLRARDEILYILNILPRLLPFNLLDVESEKKLIQETFTKENAAYLMEYYTRRAEVSLKDEGTHLFGTTPDGYNEFCKEATAFVNRVSYLLRFYDSFREDFDKAHTKLISFIKGLDSLEHYNESSLLAHAYKIFGTNRFNVGVEYVAVPKSSKSSEQMLVKRLHFRSYYSFILTDFFEGLALGHYPRRCEVCKQYFLMENARRQKYCTGYAPTELTGGKQLTCRQYAAKMGKKEKAADDPIKTIYEKRCSCIRAEISKGAIDMEFAEAAKELAKELKIRADYDDNYTFEEYQRNMERDNLYKMVELIIKQE